MAEVTKRICDWCAQDLATIDDDGQGGKVYYLRSGAAEIEADVEQDGWAMEFESLDCARQAAEWGGPALQGVRDWMINRRGQSAG